MAQTAVFVASLFLAGLVSVQGLVVDCENFNPMMCKKDLIPYCLVNGTVVAGSCNAEKAQCLDKVSVDDTFAACGQSQTTFDCSSFNPMVCQTDAIPFCLNNGTVVQGRCHAQKAVCLENKQVDDTFHACNHPDNKSKMSNDDGNAAFQSTANIFLVITVFIATIFH